MQSPSPTASGPQLPDRRKRSGALKDQAYDQIKRRIVSGDLRAGAFLTEQELSKSLGMSKTPVRVALERLEQEGFVRVSPQRGIVVRELSTVEIADQFELRLALEGFAMSRLAGQLSSDQIERIEASLAQQHEAARVHDVGSMVTLDTGFHLLFCEFLGNREICRAMGLLRDRISIVMGRVFIESDAERIFGSLNEHRAIARAVISGNPELALKRLAKHFESGKHILIAPRR